MTHVTSSSRDRINNVLLFFALRAAVTEEDILPRDA